MSDGKKGVAALFLAYFCWGTMPVYWKALEHISSSEILGHRVIWSAVFTLALILARKAWGATRDFVCKNPRQTLWLAAGGFLITTNWGLYIWAINHGRILESSLGYFINPLVSMFFGLVFFRERLRRFQVLAILLALAGVLAELVAVGSLPLVSLGLAVTFGLYGVLKKSINTTPEIGLFIETVTVTPFALAFLWYMQKNGAASFPYDAVTTALLAGTGIMTSIPLILFAFGARRVRLTTLGFVQYVSPTLTFLLGTLVYKEPLLISRITTFAFIWAALAIYSIDAVIQNKRAQM